MTIAEKISMSFDKFYTFDELTDFLRAGCDAYPGLASMDSIGKSYEGRDIWAVTLTSQETGPARDKPAMYIDGNIHAGEVTGCAVCMYTIQYLLNNYENDNLATHLLDTRAFYILPRVNPDGAELYLTSPHLLRSSVRPNPKFELKDNHLYSEDVNGDGEIISMRIEDPNGSHKISGKDPRLMIPREPDDFGDTYYSLYPEGTIHNYDGDHIRIGPWPWDLDINRNFPAGWVPTQQGAGTYPLSEPETRAMVDFILGHKNIATLQAYHTFAGIILRPSCTKPDDKLNKRDVEAFVSVGEMGEKTTGYPVKSVFHGFTRDKGIPRHGVFIDWIYEHLGILGYTTELWDKYSRAGIKRDDLPFGKPVPEEQMLKLMQWHDEEGLDSFVPWHRFEHPQLGEVELGGFKLKTFQQNTHFKFLEDECHKNTIFSLQQAAATPLLRVTGTEVTEAVPGVVRVSVDIRNTGYLSTSVTARAGEVKAVDPIEVLIEGEGIEILDGKQKQEIGHLEGYGRESRNSSGRPPANHKRVNWLIKTNGAREVSVAVKSQRAGSICTPVQVGEV